LARRDTMATSEAINSTNPSVTIENPDKLAPASNDGDARPTVTFVPQFRSREQVSNSALSRVARCGGSP
jgi:hypothetical protein